MFGYDLCLCCPQIPPYMKKITWSLASKNSKLFKTRVQQCDYWPQHCGFWFLGVGQPLISSCTVRCILVQTFFPCQTIISMWDLGEYHTIQDCHMATFFKKLLIANSWSSTLRYWHERRVELMALTRVSWELWGEALQHWNSAKMAILSTHLKF